MDQEACAAAPVERTSLERVLLERFGHAGFRAGQREVIDSVLSGRDTLAILPTGGGKSVTYQLPALVRGRCSLVISPLVALMGDQVSQALRRGLRAASVDSTLDAGQRSRVLADVREGSLELLYAAPEALPRLAADLGGTRAFGLFAVDEAHCISQWGRDFRPDYRTLARARTDLTPASPLLAVTATATARVERDITASLGMCDPFVFRGSFFRPNLRLCALRKDGARDGREAVAALLRGCTEGSAIVYRLSRAGATSLAGWLRRRGVPALAYHAGLDAEHRAFVQEEFLSGCCRVVVATVAFGMGVDKPDVRLVIHADLPDSLESYAQEVGRAGRDGLPSECVLLYAWSDVRRREALARDAEPDRRAYLRAAVREMYRFAAGGGCRQRALCAHFGETVASPCGACDACGAVSPGRLLAGGGW
jgi:ATP-dependent DNA helicase RecQ